MRYCISLVQRLVRRRCEHFSSQSRKLRASAVLARLALGSEESAVGRSAILPSHEISQHCSVSVVQDSHQLRGHLLEGNNLLSFSTDSTEAIDRHRQPSRLSVYI